MGENTLGPVLETIRRLGPDGGGAWSGTTGGCGIAVAAALRTRPPEDVNGRQPLVGADETLVVGP